MISETVEGRGQGSCNHPSKIETGWLAYWEWERLPSKWTRDAHHSNFSECAAYKARQNKKETYSKRASLAKWSPSPPPLPGPRSLYTVCLQLPFLGYLYQHAWLGIASFNPAFPDGSFWPNSWGRQSLTEDLERLLLILEVTAANQRPQGFGPVPPDLLESEMLGGNFLVTIRRGHTW